LSDVDREPASRPEAEPAPAPAPAPGPQLARCPDCGAPQPTGAVECAECHHPLAPAGAESAVRPRRPVNDAERAPATVATWGYRPAGARGGSDVPGWLWAGLGLFALGVLLVTAIQIATAPKPLVVPNATPPQQATAESLSVALRADSSAVAPNVALGNLLYDTGNYDLAIPYYRRALATDPSLVDVQVDLAVSHHNVGRSEEARAILEDAVRRHPGHAVAHFDLGIVYQQLGRSADARAMLARARTLGGPEEMVKVIDRLIVHLDSGASGDGLPPGHPPVGAGTP
jgi:hypothetical protein